MARTPSSKRQIVEKWALQVEGRILLLDGFDKALVGVAQQFNKPPLAVYDYDKIIKILCREMSHADAVEFFEFNIGGAWFGEGTPLTCRSIRRLGVEVS